MKKPGVFEFWQSEVRHIKSQTGRKRTLSGTETGKIPSENSVSLIIFTGISNGLFNGLEPGVYLPVIWILGIQDI